MRKQPALLLGKENKLYHTKKGSSKEATYWPLLRMRVMKEESPKQFPERHDGNTVM